MPRQVESVLPLGLTLGEGPVWDSGTQCLWLVDIKQKIILRYDPATGATDRWDSPLQVGWILPAQNGAMLAGLQNGVYRFDPASGELAPLSGPEPDLPGNRLNDATTDRAGRVWLGTMDDAEAEPRGRFYTFQNGVCRDAGLPPVTITNGPALSPDDRWLYHTDTLGRRIWRSRLENGVVVETAPFIDIEDGAGHPDGPTVDAEGCLWTGLFGGWAVRRYDTEGRLMEQVDFPVANVTKIAFGGPDLATAYATTARKGLDAAALARQPAAGNLFAFDAGVRGLPVTPAMP